MASHGDLALTRALARADELRSRIAADERAVASATARLKADAAELRKVERFISSAHAFVAGEALPAVRPANPDRREVGESALAIIRAAQRPLRRRELHQRLIDQGVVINGKDPEMVLGTMLYRDDRIVRIKGFGYWPKEEAYDPAFYLPEHEGVIGATENTPDADD